MPVFAKHPTEGAAKEDSLGDPSLSPPVQAQWHHFVHQMHCSVVTFNTARVHMITQSRQSQE